MKRDKIDFSLPFNERVDGSNPSSLKSFDLNKFLTSRYTYCSLTSEQCVNPKISTGILLDSYFLLLQDIKTRIRESQIKAALAVNQELIQLYWWIGKEIVTRQT